MEFHLNEDLKHILQPFLFVLKEGTEIREDFLDYSLLMLQVSCAETIKSPGKRTQRGAHYPILHQATPQETASKTIFGH